MNAQAARVSIGRGLWGPVAFAVVGLIFAVSLAAPGASFVTAIFASIGAMIILAIALELRTIGGIGPITIVGGSAAVLFVVKPLYISAVGRYGPTLRQKFAIDPSDNQLVTVGVLVVVSVVCIYFGYRLALRRIPFNPIARGIVRPPVVVLSLSFAVSAMTALWLVQGQGGLASYLAALGSRAAVFGDKAWMLVPLSAYKWAAVATVALMLMRDPSRRVPVRYWLALLPAIFFDGLSGGRAALLIDTALPLVLLIPAVGKRFTFRRFFALLAIAGLVFVTSRALLRDRHLVENRKLGSSELVQQSISNFDDTALGGLEAVPVDSLLYMMNHVPSELSFQYGKTISSVLTFPIPRAIWAEKPKGGNELFTSTFFPKFYGTGKVETSIGLMGDLYLNFGKIGLPIGGLLWGLSLAFLWNRARIGSGPARVAALAALARMAVALRGDIFHSLTTAALSAVTVYVIAVLLVRGQRAMRETPAFL